jgi:hypothetical protein
LPIGDYDCAQGGRVRRRISLVNVHPVGLRTERANGCDAITSRER